MVTGLNVGPPVTAGPPNWGVRSAADTALHTRGAGSLFSITTTSLVEHHGRTPKKCLKSSYDENYNKVPIMSFLIKDNKEIKL